MIRQPKKKKSGKAVAESSIKTVSGEGVDVLWIGSRGAVSESVSE